LKATTGKVRGLRVRAKRPINSNPSITGIIRSVSDQMGMEVAQAVERLAPVVRLADVEARAT
jgi:hypothetical protein